MNPALAVDPDRWRRIEIVLDQALDLPPDQRDVLLDTACAGDPGLRSEVESLLAADAKAGAFLGEPVGEYAPELLAEVSGVEEDEEDLAGQQLGPYRLLREIGGGGMGTVYEAEDTRLGRRVAVKLLPTEVSRDRRAKERFLREARAASAVDHPNLCTVHDVGESEGRLYIVLAFYEGETLRERLRRGPLPLAEARDVAIQVARGLVRAHEAGIVHRDIKPANVMLTRRGEVKILDFGIARLESDPASITRTGGSWGTPAYMSPEQARGDSVDARTDVWSLGVLIYEMVAGRRPFGGESLEAVVASILTQEPEPLERVCPEIPSEFAKVVERALAKHPAERYASAAEMLGDLETGRVMDRRLLRKALRVALASGVLVCLVLVGFVLWRLSRPPLRVAVLQPVVKSQGHHPDLAFVGSEVVEAVFSTLVSLEGVQPLDPPERDEKSGSEIERLRATDAAEVLVSRLECRDDLCRMTFRRQKPGGEVVGTIDPIEVQLGVENAHQLAEAVRVILQQLYHDYSVRHGSGGGNVRPEDYSAYIEFERRVDRGEHLGIDELDRLDALLRTSPDLLGAYILGAGSARLQGDFDRALDYASRAEKIAPYDPRPLITRLHIELETNRLNAAQATLARLADLAPSDTRVQIAEVELLEAQGELEKAHTLQEKITQRRPTWRQILKLATLEVRLGADKEARRRLEDLLAEQPDNQYVRERLAALEALSGDLERAAALYEDLVRTESAPPYFTTNLGLIRFLLGEYGAAEAAYRRALAVDPDDRMSRFNLATTLEAQGDRAGAQRLYRALAKELAAEPLRLDPHARMLHAQCLARLGQRLAAASLADEALKQRPEDVQILHQAAQVYAILGDRLSALFYTKLAREKGRRREWFTIPEFRSLEEDPDFRALLER